MTWFNSVSAKGTVETFATSSLHRVGYYRPAEILGVVVRVGFLSPDHVADSVRCDVCLDELEKVKARGVNLALVVCREWL